MRARKRGILGKINKFQGLKKEKKRDINTIFHSFIYIYIYKNA